MIGPDGVALHDRDGITTAAVPAREIVAIEREIGNRVIVHALDGRGLVISLSRLDDRRGAAEAVAELRPDAHVPLSARQQVVDDAIRGPHGFAVVAPGAADRILHELDPWGHHLTLLRLDRRRHEVLDLAVLSDALLLVLPSGHGSRVPAADISGVVVRGRRGRELQLRLGGEPVRIRLADGAAADHARRAIEGARARAEQRGDGASSDIEAQTVMRKLLAVKPRLRSRRPRPPRLRLPRVRIAAPAGVFIGLFVALRLIPVASTIVHARDESHAASSPRVEVVPAASVAAAPAAVVPAGASLYSSAAFGRALRRATRAMGSEVRITGIQVHSPTMLAFGGAPGRQYAVTVTSRAVLRRLRIPPPVDRGVPASSVDTAAVTALVAAAAHRGIGVDAISGITVRVTKGRVAWRLEAGGNVLVADAQGRRVHAA